MAKAEVAAGGADISASRYGENTQYNGWPEKMVREYTIAARRDETSMRAKTAKAEATQAQETTQYTNTWGHGMKATVVR